MKIGLTGHLFTRLAEGGRMKKTNADMKKGLLDRLDVSTLSCAPDKAVVEYLKTIDELLSDIIRMVDNGPVLSGGEDIRAVSQAVPRQPSVTRADTVVYLPGISCGDGGPEIGGEFIIIKDALAEGMTDMPGEGGRSAPEVLSEKVAAELSGAGAGMGMKTDDPSKITVRDKFIISVDLKGGTPVPSVIRHDRFGGTNTFREVPGNIEDEVTASIVSKTAALLAGKTGGVSSGDGGVFRAAGPEKAVWMPMDGPEGLHAETGVTGRTLELPPDFDPLKTAKKTASFLSAKKEHLGFEKARGWEYDGVPDTGPSGFAGGVFRSDEFPGVTVRVIPSSMSAVLVAKNARMENDRETVVERLSSLVQVINDGITGYSEDMEPAMDGNGVRPGTEAIEAFVKQAVLKSAQIAASGPASSAGLPGEAGAGIWMDEKGRLMADKEVLAGAFSETRDEAVRFVHGFSNSLRERIAYFFHPFAGFYSAGAGGATGVEKAGGKEGAAYEEGDMRADFEMKLNEIRMLLESSYQLKEVFMDMGPSGSVSGDDG